MNISYAQAVALGGLIAEEARRIIEGDRRAIDPVLPHERSWHPKGEDGLNKTERRFRDEVTSLVHRIRRESLKFRLAGRTWYTPDFIVQEFPYGTPPLCVEIKGFMRDDAAVKLKTAASLYPEFRWLLVRAIKGGWDVREVTGRGIGRERIAMAWIPGSA